MGQVNTIAKQLKNFKKKVAMQFSIYKNKKYLFTLAFALFFLVGNCQLIEQLITLELAQTKAFENSRLLKNEKLKIEYLNSLTKTAYEIPNTDIVSEFGQFNSNLFDAKIGIQQSIKNPKFYKKQKELLDIEASLGKIDEALTYKIITNEVSRQFYHQIYLQEKIKLLLKNDSVFTKFIAKTKLQVANGEKNALDLALAENELDIIKIQLSELNFNYKQAKENFKFALNTTENFIPNSNNLLIDFTPNQAIENIDNQHSIKVLAHELDLNSAKIGIENAKKLPDLSAGLFLQSFKFNTDNQPNYLGTFGQFGISFPFFNSVQKQRNIALKINKQIIENKIVIEKKQLNFKYQELLNGYHKLKDQLKIYENSILKKVILVKELSAKQYQLGELNFKELLLITSQNTTIQNNYLDILNGLNQTIIDLKFQNND